MIGFVSELLGSFLSVNYAEIVESKNQRQIIEYTNG